MADPSGSTGSTTYTELSASSSLEHPPLTMGDSHEHRSECSHLEILDVVSSAPTPTSASTSSAAIISPALVPSSRIITSLSHECAIITRTPPTPTDVKPDDPRTAPLATATSAPQNPLLEHARLSNSPASIAVEHIPSSASTPSSTPAEATPASAPSQRRRQSSTFTVPLQFARPGIEMLKVSSKSARRVKPRNLWLELVSEASEEGELGRELELELGLGVVGGQNVRICWEKNGLGLGRKKEASVPLARIRDLRFGSQGSPYRTSLQISAEVESRWMTITYIRPQTSRNVLNSSSASYKLVHFIAPTVATLEMWRTTLERFREGRVARSFAPVNSSNPSSSEPPCGEGDRVVKEADVYQLCTRLGMGMGQSEIGHAFRKTAAPRDYLDFAAFQRFVKLLKRREDVEEIFQSVAGAGQDSISQESWLEFLTQTQQVPIASEALARSFVKYADPESRRISLEGLTSYLMSSDNAPIKDESAQDMGRPLSEYFISSSHNTYLVGNQVQGKSTVEGYIRALQQGCRCVELDVYDGDEGEPVVTHGLTLTSKIALRDVLLAIAQYAFLASPYPVILSMEVHCDIPQQNRIVELLTSILGESLITSRIEDIKGAAELERLPSPSDLKGKFLLKAKNKFLSSSNPRGAPLIVSPSDDTTSSTESASSDSDLGKVLRAVRRRVSSARSPSTLTPRSGNTSPVRPSAASYSSSASTCFNQAPPTRVSGPAPRNAGDGEAAPSPKPGRDDVMSSALLALLVYTVGVKARGFNKKETYDATHVISVGESSLKKIIREEGACQDFIAHNRGHLTRAYPKGSRLNSSNFDPHHMWAVGVQLVALNWQTFDVGMQLNSAMFSRVGRSGYVLKPELLRKKGGEKDKTALARSRSYRLELEVISAQQLPRPRDADSTDKSDPAPIDPFIEASLFQPGVLAPLKKRTRIVRGNAFNPIFGASFTFDFTAHPSAGMLDLIFLSLEVLTARGNIKAAAEDGKGDFLGAYAVAVGVLLPGYRHVPLYDDTGDQHLFSTVFVKSKVSEVDPSGAS